MPAKNQSKPHHRLISIFLLSEWASGKVDCARCISLSRGNLARRMISSLSYLIFLVEAGSVLPEVVALVWLVV